MFRTSKLVLPSITTLNLGIAYIHYKVYKKLSKDAIARYDPLFIVC